MIKYSQSTLSSPTSISSSPNIKHKIFQIQPSECWLTWDDIPVVSPIHIKKKAKLPGGQFTMTQILSPPTDPPANHTVTEQKEPKLSYPWAPNQRAPRIVKNDAIIVLLENLQRDLQCMIEQVRDAFFTFNHPAAFLQKKWIDDGLTNAIKVISDCEVTVSVMGMNDMKSYLQDIGNDDTFILIKNLAVYHGYGVLIDINHSDHSCTFHVVHELYLRNSEGVNFGQTKFEYGTTTANLDESVFNEIEE